MSSRPGRTSSGIRFPSHVVTRALIDSVGAPITSTSANVTGAPPAMCAEDVKIERRLRASKGEKPRWVLRLSSISLIMWWCAEVRASTPCMTELGFYLEAGSKPDRASRAPFLFARSIHARFILAVSGGRYFVKKAKKYEVSSIEHTLNARNGRHVASFGSRRDSRLS